MIDSERNFSWHIAGILAASGGPSPGGRAGDWHAYWKSKNFVHIVNLTEREHFPPEPLVEWHYPTNDMYAPSLDDVVSIHNLVLEAAAKQQPVLIHCWAGIGRTGTVLACLHQSLEGRTLAESMEYVHTRRRGPQTRGQAHLIEEWEKKLPRLGLRKLPGAVRP